MKVFVVPPTVPEPAGVAPWGTGKLAGHPGGSFPSSVSDTWPSGAWMAMLCRLRVVVVVGTVVVVELPPPPPQAATTRATRNTPTIDFAVRVAEHVAIESS